MSADITTSIHSTISPTLCHSSNGRFYALRLQPGDDLFTSLQQYVKQASLQAVAVVTCVGSLTQFNLRFGRRT